MRHFVLIFAGLLIPSYAGAQTACRGLHESMLTGTVRDSTEALIPGAMLTLDNGRTTTSMADGRFRFACVADGTHQLAAEVEGFAPAAIAVKVPQRGELALLLKLKSVQTSVTVNAGDQTLPDTNSTGASTTLAGKQLQSLADDPDDLLRELQQLGALTGGDPANTVITVDGYQGSSKLPPKSAIAYIKVNPDLYSAEYHMPPYDGGRVEVYTKPGQPRFHGALFATNGSPWENARDPFSPEKASIGKQRYGFELTGPVRKTGSDFELDLEHRSIDDFAVVNAITLDTSGNQVNTVANVATPQRLWIGEAKLDWQLGAKNTFIATYSANVNNLENVGVGGTMLADTGYNSGQYEHVLRLSDVTVMNAHLMHEGRVSVRWDGEDDLPNSSAPQVQVSGTFTSGGATIGNQQLHELNVEADDDAIVTMKNHTLKFGTQFMLYNEHQQLTTNFNGTYTFGGGTAPVLGTGNAPVPGQSITISGIEQYRRALLGLAGGTPTAFSDVVGTPAVNFTQVQDAVYLQDEWEARHGLHVSAGLRYFVQNDPTVLGALTPRVGILWSPTKKGTWTLHAHAGLFTNVFPETDEAEVLREDGTARVTSTIYNPIYGNPFVNATPIHSVRAFSPHIAVVNDAGEDVGGTRALPHGWNLMADYTFGRIWNDIRSENINAPLNDSPQGPRLLGVPDIDLLQVQNSAQDKLNDEFIGIEQHSLESVQLFLGGVRIKIIGDTDDNAFFTPQSTFTDAGEFAYVSNLPTWEVFGDATFTLPGKVQLSGNLNGRGDQHYNITTGADNNGDGDFNDRPQYALPGTPVCTPNAMDAGGCAALTRFGLLVDSGGEGVFPRNKGVLPWKFYLDSNIQRAFTLTRKPKAEHQQVLTVNLRSSNVLNHTNVLQVGSVLGSPLFGLPYEADNGRRVELGLRYGF